MYIQEFKPYNHNHDYNSSKKEKAALINLQSIPLCPPFHYTIAWTGKKTNKKEERVLSWEGCGEKGAFHSGALYITCEKAISVITYGRIVRWLPISAVPVLRRQVHRRLGVGLLKSACSCLPTQQVLLISSGL